jgi:hypothetical protein
MRGKEAAAAAVRRARELEQVIERQKGQLRESVERESILTDRIRRMEQDSERRILEEGARIAGGEIARLTAELADEKTARGREVPELAERTFALVYPFIEKMPGSGPLVGKLADVFGQSHRIGDLIPNSGNRDNRRITGKDWNLMGEATRGAWADKQGPVRRKKDGLTSA